jgi:hypothetical protein
VVGIVMKKRTMISTKDHYLILDEVDGQGDEMDSGSNFEGLGTPLEIIYIGFLLDGTISTFRADETKDSGYSHHMTWHSNVLYSSNALSLNFKIGSVAATDNVSLLSIWPKYGPVGERTSAGMYLATSEDYYKMKQNPEEGFVLEGYCNLHTVRDIENFSHVAANTYIK